MNKLFHVFIVFFVSFLLVQCKKQVENSIKEELPTEFKGKKSIEYNQISFDVMIDKPALKELNVLLVFHGTVLYDSSILDAASNILEKFKELTDRKDIMIVSVAYPGEKLLLGDNIIQAEAALLWLKNQANQDLNIKINKVFLAGHSQGAYLATRLNTMHKTDGVIANAPGPLNLVYRCQLEENGQIQSGATCNKLKNIYGTTSNNQDEYFKRSLLNFTNGFKSDILFVQGLADTPIQMYSWPTFKTDVMNCKNCQNSQFLEIVGGEHASLFSSPLAKIEFNKFLNSRIEQ